MNKLAFGFAFASFTLAAPAIAADVTFGTPTLLGQYVFPTGLSISGVEFGGISGMDYDAKNDVYYAISDDRSEHGAARFYTLKLKIDEKGIHGVDVVSMVPLKGADGQTFAVKNVDPESIRFDEGSGHVFWSSEGDAKGVPAIYEAQTDGTVVRMFEIPAYYMPNADQTQGIASNLAFEALSFTPDHKFLFAGIENGLIQDGGKTTLDAGSTSRILKFDITTGKPVAEYPLQIEKVPAPGSDGKTNDNGMSEFLALNDSTILTLERGFALGYGNQSQLYTVSLDGATDVLGKATIKGTDFTPAKKTNVMTLKEGDFGGVDVDNVEDLTWGPVVGGKPTLIIASDNNFSASEFTQFLVFTLDGCKAD